MEQKARRTRLKPAYSAVNQLQSEFTTRKTQIRNRLEDFASITPDHYFYELVYCLLTPQSSAVNAGKAVEALRASNLFEQEIEPSGLLHQKEFYIRFHNTKGTHIKEAKRQFTEIASTLSNGHSSVELREWLVRNVKGLGWKEASHFLRNIGHKNLAILDRHILKNLKRHKVISSLPKALTPKRYLAIERKFQTFAGHLGITMDELDLLFWSRETGEILK
jgi:N-glycosylase/DNA lyase